MNPFLKAIINKKFILKHLSPEQIFERYLGIPVVYNKLQKATHRRDPKPSVGFKKTNRGDIICSDFGDTKIKGDCFNIVSSLHSCSYEDALLIIADDFNLLNINVDKTQITQIYKPPKLEDPSEKEITPIKIKRRDWTEQDLKFWNQFGISKETLEFFKVSPISHYWYGNDVRVCKSMSFAYYFAPFCYKIYSPLEKVYRFINNSQEIQGWNQLPESGDLLILSKSLKDVMVFYEYGITACALQAESNMLHSNKYELLKNKFKTIISNYDFDLAGIRGSGNLKRRYGIPRIMFSTGRLGTTNYGSKDISDMYLEQGEEKVKEIINKIKRYE